jgi:hypothetical protein
MFVGLTLGSSVWRPPFPDEGWFANAGDNLFRHGHLGITGLDENGHLGRPTLLRIQSRTYWVLPAYLVTTGVWFAALGSGLLQIRLLSVFWGVCALVSTYYIVRQLSENVVVARLATTLLAINEAFVIMGSFGRMEMMCLATGLSGQAAYLFARRRNLKLALFYAHAFVCLSLLTHPNGLVAFLMVSALVLALDRERITRRDILPALTPYIFGASLYAAYVFQDLVAFQAQISGNVPGERFRGLLHPVAAISDEIRRWASHYGLSPSAHSFASIKTLIPATLLGSLALFALRRPRRLGDRLLLFAAAIPLGVLTFFNVKLWFYLIYTSGPLASVLAAWAYSSWHGGFWRRVLAAGFLAAYAGASLSTDLYRFRYWPEALREFARVSDAARQQLCDQERINAPAHFAFALGFDTVLHDDSLGYYSAKGSRMYIESKRSPEELAVFRRTIPELQSYREHLLATEYTILLETGGYRLYRSVVGGCVD